MILVDKREGSRQLADHLPKHLVQLGEYDADVAFMGNGPDDEPIILGIEYKQITDILACIRDGRFSGVQLPRMIDTYGSGRIYLLIEGAYRVDPVSGFLELRRFIKGKGLQWVPAQLGQDAWLARQLHNWINTMVEMTGMIVWHTYNIEESAAWVLDLFIWWSSKNYSEHRSHLKWASPNARLQAASRKRGNRNILVPQQTSSLPLVRKWAADCPTIGPDKSLDVAKHFKTPFALAMGDKKDWQKIPGIGKIGADRIVKAIQGEE